ncbi:hypothetical protein AZL_010710 [Azospirillum sp. B510]|uniref:hypothetical protein n=1 Tax=Azospirillum sp. (strain B510) TaxID=137722 RepID=UPI0001C4BE2D|nr:hypothetical protein [Azospirillum sp. B510]BAI71709.1 hypothetical protein AZL_010710 [Azospirillum sp. B510]
MDDADDKHSPTPHPAGFPADETHRLTAEELAFLLRDPMLRARAAERAARSNRLRTERRASDPAYAEKLRAGDRERQQRRRRRNAIGRPEPAERPATTLPDLTLPQAARLLSEYLAGSTTAQAAQLRGRPDRVRLYAEAFVTYRTLSAGDVRPSCGALAALLKSRFGHTVTRSQAQKLRDHVEGFAITEGPWSPDPAASDVRPRSGPGNPASKRDKGKAGSKDKAGTDGHAPRPSRP